MNTNPSLIPQYAITASYAPVSSYTGYALSGSYITNPSSAYFPIISGGLTFDFRDEGATRWYYNNDNEEDLILEKIEKENLIILDESDEDSEMPHWYDVIDQKKMNENLSNPVYLDEETIDKIIEELDIIGNELKEQPPPNKTSLFQRIKNVFIFLWTLIY